MMVARYSPNATPTYGVTGRLATTLRSAPTSAPTPVVLSPRANHAPRAWNVIHRVMLQPASPATTGAVSEDVTAAAIEPPSSVPRPAIFDWAGVCACSDAVVKPTIKAAGAIRRGK